MSRSLEEVRQVGLDALRERLGPADMIRFLQQFESGSGDYARERHEWADAISLDDIARQCLSNNESIDEANAQ